MVNGKKPVNLNNSVIGGGGFMTNCSISRDGKRLYFFGRGLIRYQDMWCSEWNEILNDWNPAVNMGPVVNCYYGHSYVWEVNKDTIFATGAGFGFPDYFIYDKSLNEWANIDSFWYHPIGGADMFGLSLTKDKKKMYFGKYRTNGDWGFDLAVCYWDTTTNYWGNVYYLNINTEQVPVDKGYTRGAEYYPWISENGKVMIFASNRDVPLHHDSSHSSTLYISYLLIDENGNFVLTEDQGNPSLINTFSLEQNYPNPFNPSTTIRYSVAESGNIRLNVYDMLGRKITELVNEYKNKGEYKITFDAQKFNLASGVYYYQLINGNNSLVKKMILAK